jgi:hypothetical protein
MITLESAGPGPRLGMVLGLNGGIEFPNLLEHQKRGKEKEADNHSWRCSHKE